MCRMYKLLNYGLMIKFYAPIDVVKCDYSPCVYVQFFADCPNYVRIDLPVVSTPADVVVSSHEVCNGKKEFAVCTSDYCLSDIRLVDIDGKRSISYAADSIESRPKYYSAPYECKD